MRTVMLNLGQHPWRNAGVSCAVGDGPWILNQVQDDDNRAGRSTPRVERGRNLAVDYGFDRL